MRVRKKDGNIYVIVKKYRKALKSYREENEILSNSVLLKTPRCANMKEFIIERTWTMSVALSYVAIATQSSCLFIL